MEGNNDRVVARLFGSCVFYMRKCLFDVLSMGPIPSHIAFILDGNRRYAKKENLGEGMGHRAGFLALMSMMKYCYELGVKYMTIYAFSIDNFKRQPDEVEHVMDLMLEKIEGLVKEESIVKEYGVRVYFIGNLKLLREGVRIAAERAMKVTANNKKTKLIVCVAYTSTDEIVHAAQECCCEIEEREENGVIKLSDVDREMYMNVAPNPDILIRTSGETRLSNFLLWQTWNCVLYSPNALWPEIGLRHLVWAIFNFQRIHPYLEKIRKEFRYLHHHHHHHLPTLEMDP